MLNTTEFSDLPIDIVQHIGLLTHSTSDYLNLALCNKQHLKILQNPRKWRVLKQFTQTFKTKHSTGYTINGRLHREDGYAIMYANGTKIWYINGQRHRENGPAYISRDGSKSWWIKGVLHKYNMISQGVIYNNI